MSDSDLDPGFAPQDLSDGREKGNWKSRYLDKEAINAIRYEAIYGAALLFLCPILLLLIWLKSYDIGGVLSDVQCNAVCRYAYGWVGGLFGGTLFVLKWLYHSVAHGSWNKDRRLWRLLAPHLSGALAFVFICMIDSQIFLIFDSQSIKSPPVVVSVSFLVGYFSDTTLAKMSEIAVSLFGAKGASS